MNGHHSYIFSYPLIFICFLVLFFIAPKISAQQAGGNESSTTGELGLFESDDLLELSLSMDMKKVIRDVGEDKSYHDAFISYTDQSGDSIVLPVEVRTRGHFRLDPINCDFPPLMLNFDPDDIHNTLFEGMDKIKLVTHCRRNDYYEQCLLKEYLVYKLYNLFTAESYRARLAKVNYVDLSGKKNPVHKLAFFIEPTEHMASRNNCEIISIQKIHQESTHREKTLLLSIFQYMIGNTDWSVPSLHNIRLIKSDQFYSPVAVPYDFDWCGLVNAPYAIPAPILEITSVTDRKFRGFCRPEDEFTDAFSIFREKKKEIYETCENVYYLTEKEYNKVIKYLDEFFLIIDNPRSVKNEFYNNCRTQ